MSTVDPFSCALLLYRADFVPEMVFFINTVISNIYDFQMKVELPRLPKIVLRLTKIVTPVEIVAESASRPGIDTDIHFVF